MKIKHLLSLLLALPLVFAACEKTPEPEPQPQPDPTPDPTPEYVVDMEMVAGVRTTEIPEYEMVFADNQFMLTFVDETQAHTLTLFIFGDEGEKTLQAGTYTEEDMEMAYSAYLYGEEAVQFDKANVVVAVKTNVYDIEAVLTDAEGGKYHFTFEGEIINMDTNEEPEPSDDYLFNEEMAYASRVSLAEYGFPNNYYLIAFYSENENILMGVVLVGPEGESVLSAGTYTAENGGVMLEGLELYVGETEEYFFEGGDATIVVGGDIEGYTFDIDLTDAEGQKYHFTYEGTVEGMEIENNLPTEDVKFVAEYLDGVYYGTEYSEAYNYYITLSDVGFDSEGYALASGNYYRVDLYSVEGDIDSEGYIHIPAGTYTFDVNSTYAEWTFSNAYSNYSKINDTGTAYDAQAKYEAGEAIVTENGITLTVTIEGVEHSVTYNGTPKIYVGGNGGGATPGESVDFTANYTYAMYFGDQYTPGYADNYYLFLSDLGLDADGYELPNGTYYRFDLYAPITESNLTKIPAGTYTIDMYDSGNPWTASLSYSAYYVMDEYGWDYVDFDYPGSGTIVIGEDGSITAEITMLSSGATHNVTSTSGNIDIIDASSGGGSSDGTYSTLTDDVYCNLSNHTLYYENYGDWYEVGYDNWLVAIMPNNQVGDFVQFDLLVSDSDFYGTYTISDSLGAGTSYTGYIDYYGYFGGSWYYTEDGSTCAPFMGGWVEIIDNGDGTATVEFEVWDDCNYYLEGNCNCRIAPVSELQSVTRSGNSLKQFKSVVINNEAPAAKTRIVAKNTAKTKSVADKSLKLR